MIGIDMKMPKCCGDCDLENNGCFCVVTGDNTFFYRNKWRMDNCPLRPLDDENRGAVSMALMDLPSAQPETNCSEFPNNSDTISRQAAIDAVEALAYHADKYVIDSDVHEVHGFRTGLAVAERQLSLVPSAQPEIIRCGECKYYTPVTAHCEIRGKGLYLIRGMEDFCSRAERRTDET